MTETPEITIYPLYERNDEKFDIVFIHGLDGHWYNTWTNHRREFWPKRWLTYDVQMKAQRFRVFSVRYDNGIVNNNANIEERAQSILRVLIQAKIGTKPTVFIVHSMGGLLLKQILLEANSIQNDPIRQQLINQTKGIAFYATPHKGDWVASVFKFVSAPLYDLSKQKATELSNRFEQFILGTHSINVINFIETQKLGPKKVVTSDAAQLSNKITVPILGANHINICKPDSKDSLAYRELVQWLFRILSN